MSGIPRTPSPRDPETLGRKLTRRAAIAASASAMALGLSGASGDALASTRSYESNDSANPNFIFDRGTARQIKIFEDVIDKCTFNWDALPQKVTIHFQDGLGAITSTRAQIWVDPAEVDTKSSYYSGIVQHELGHQVDFLLLTDRDRAKFSKFMGSPDWSPPLGQNPNLDHGKYGREMFASTFAAACDPDDEPDDDPDEKNVIFSSPESRAMPAKKFMSLLTSVLKAKGLDAVKPAARPITPPRQQVNAGPQAY